MKPRNRAPGVWIRVLVLGAAVAAAAPGCNPGEAGPADPPPPPSASPVPVRAVTARRTILRPSADLVGRLVAIPERTAILTARQEGWIDAVLVVEGQVVAAGEEILRLDPRIPGIELAKSEAAVRERRAVLDRLKRGPRPQEIESATHEEERTRFAWESLRARLDALADLRSRSEVSDVSYQSLKLDVEAARALHESAQARLALLEAGTRPEEIAEGEARLAEAEADRSAADLALRLCRVTSPIAGIVTELLARQSQNVSAGTPLATVRDLSSLFAEIRIPAALLAGVRVGSRVEATLDTFPGERFEGEVTRLGAAADPHTGSVHAFARIPNDRGLLRPELTVRVRLWLPAVEGAVAIPRGAVSDRLGTPVVTVVREGRAHEIEVRLGAAAGGLVQVTGGLDAGDLVAVEGGYGLPDGCPVRVVTEPEGSAAPSRAPQESR